MEMIILYLEENSLFLNNLFKNLMICKLWRMEIKKLIHLWDLINIIFLWEDHSTNLMDLCLDKNNSIFHHLHLDPCQVNRNLIISISHLHHLDPCLDNKNSIHSNSSLDQINMKEDKEEIKKEAMKEKEKKINNGKVKNMEICVKEVKIYHNF